MTSLCFIDMFPDECVLQRISSLTSLCFSDLVRGRGCVVHQIRTLRVCALAIRSLTSLCFADQFPNEFVRERINSMMSLCLSELVP